LRDEPFDSVANMHEDAVVDDAEHLRRDHLSRRKLVEDRRPRIVPQLLDAQADLFLVVIDAEDDRLDVIPFL